MANITSPLGFPYPEGPDPADVDGDLRLLAESINNELYSGTNRVFNVKHYGAIGNGTTDDRTAFVNALSAANTAGGGIVYVPAGSYKISAVITVSAYKNIQLRGAGWQVSKIKSVGAFLSASGSSDQWTIENLQIECTAATNTVDGIYVATPRRWHITKCYFTGWGGDCIQWDDAIHSRISFNYFIAKDSSNTNGHAAIYINDNAAFSTTVVTESNYVGAGKTYGILHEGSSACSSYNDIVEGCSKAMRFDNCVNMHLVLPYFESNTNPWEINDSNVTWIGPTTEDEPTVTWSTTAVAARVLTRINRDDVKFGGSVTVSSGESSSTSAYKFLNTGAIRAFLEHTESTNTLRIDGDGAITFAPSNAVAMTALANGGFAVANRLDLPSVTSDPSNLVDGSVWYENDVDLVRARVNGVTEALGIMPVADIRTTDTGTINSTTLVALCTVTLVPGTYQFEADLGFVGNGTASTPGFNLQGTAVTSLYRWRSSLGILGISTNSSGTTIPSTTSGVAIGSIGTNTNELPWLATGRFTVTTAGTVIVAMSVTSGSGTFVGKAGSNFICHRIA